MNTRQDKVLIDSITTELDRHVDELDFNTTARLSAARHRALAKRRTAWQYWPQGVATAAVIALLVMLLPLPQTLQKADVASHSPIESVSPTIMSAADLPMLLEDDSIEFFESLEFLESISEPDFG